MKKLPLIFSVFWLAVLCATAAQRPNIIFIYIDDMGYGDLSCTGNKDVETVNIDRLASEGIRFTQFYVNSPICSPSRVACTTGQYPARHLINSYLNSRAKNRARGMADFLDPKAPAIARAFQSAGYATAHFGKWHMGGGRDVNDAPLPQAYGFDESLVSFEGIGDRILPPGGLSEASAKLGRGKIRRVEKHEQTGIYVDRAIDFVRRNRTKPFYLHLWLNDVHDAFKPREDYLKKFEKFSDQPELQKMYAVLKHMDDELGRLIRQVDESGLENKTMFVVTSDNGPTAWPRYAKQGQEPPGSTAGMRGRKWSLYEGGIRMPLIVRWKGRVPAGLVDETTVVAAVDFFPTFTKLAGVTAPEVEFDGVDMSAAFTGQARPRGQALFWDYGRQASYLRPAHPLDRSPNLAIRDGDWKLLINDDGTRTELYDLSASEREYDNVAGKHPEISKRLSERLLAWRRALPVRSDVPPVADAEGLTKTFNLKQDTRLKGAAAPKVSGNAIRVNAVVTAGGKNGVLVAQGGAAVGYSLHITQGKPVFDVRFRNELFSAKGKKALPKGRVKLTAELALDGAMTLSVDGNTVARGKATSALPSEPVDGLGVGLDDKGNVGNYEGNFVFRGIIHAASVTVQETGGSDTVGGRVTRWAGDIDRDNPWPEYPRPQLIRNRWVNLNGPWHYAIGNTNKGQPKRITGLITVPYPIESTLSGVQQTVGSEKYLWYRKSIDSSVREKGERLLLHFGAVDWETVVFVDGTKVGEHRGGYDPFSFDITDALGKGTRHELIVRVWDPTNDGFQPRGKQVKESRGIWYTSVSGIWQTVWLEPVPAVSIAGLKSVPDIDNHELALTVSASRAGSQVVKAEAFEGDRKVGEVVGFAGQVLHLPIADMKLWHPDSPHLYNLRVTMTQGGNVADQVGSYFGMRRSVIAKDKDGINRLFLNGEPIFHWGPLDQGWWPDGLYTPPTEEAMIYDLEMTRKMGFNMIRKHVKVESARWYYWADKLGLLVWQDLPSGFAGDARGEWHLKKGAEQDLPLPAAAREIYRKELKAMIDGLHNHPSIVVWVPFNEGWGQFKTTEILDWTKQYDPTRIVDGASGWTDRGSNSGEMHDMHKYPGPGMFEVEPSRASVLGEFGGLGWPVKGHLWWTKRNWGYRTYQSREELKKNYAILMKQLPALIKQGLAAAVYTQTTDVEGEVNGLMTYDRSVIKMDTGWLAEQSESLFR